MNKYLATLLLFFLGSSSAFSYEKNLSPIDENICTDGQIYSDLVLKYDKFIEASVYTQTPDDGCLFLTANNVFFEDGQLSSTDDLGGGEDLPDAEMNADKNYSSVVGWDSREDRLAWPVILPDNEELHARIKIDAIDSDLSEVILGSTVQFLIKKLDKDDEFQVIQEFTIDVEGSNYADITFSVEEEGIYYLALQAKNIAGNEVGTFKEIELSKETHNPKKNLKLIRERWRGASIYGSMKSSKIPEDVTPVLWIVQSEMIPANHSVYSPTSASFGYIGSSRREDTSEPYGFNFSIWAFSASETEDTLPPIEDMPHLITAGSPDAEYSSYGSEGTGVKFSDWDPYINETSSVQVVGYTILDHTVDNKYDQIFSYYYSPSQGDLEIYGTANVLHGKETMRDSVSFFIEDTGDSSNRRFGMTPREIIFRGWVLGSDDQWYDADIFSVNDSNPGTIEEPVSKKWSVDQDNKSFHLEMTGIKKYNTEKNTEFMLDETEPVPDYLVGKTLEDLTSYPFTKIDLKLKDYVSHSSGGSANISFYANGIDSHSEVKVFYGTQDALSYEEDINGETSSTTYTYPGWEQSQVIEGVNNGDNYITLSGLDNDTKYYYRIYAKNKQAQTWTTMTGIIRPDETVCEGVQDWDATKQYQPGEQVVYDGKLYEAERWTDIGVTPDTEYAGWVLIGDC